jgi:LysM repeat protein
MTERGLPIVDAAPACPFVAFDEDRDGRALAPDHRHRCYAEPRPAPRALAHQEAYCLSSAFPVCPTFQDWARREAAAARPPELAPRPDREPPPPVSRSMPPLDRDDRHAPDGSLRNPQQHWSAAPPWSRDEPRTPARDADAEPPSFLAGGPARAAGPDRWAGEGRGLVGSAADRLAGGVEPGDRAPTPDDLEDLDDPAGADPADDGGWMAAPPAPAAPTYRTAAPQSYRPEPRRTTRPAVDPREGDEPRGRREPLQPGEDPEELFGPAWERPRRYEAYPSLRTRMGIPQIPGVVGALAALVLAAVALFFLGPMLLGIGTDQPTSRPSGATPSATAAAPSASAETTPTPAPTAQTYMVAAGDTMSKIAAKFDITLQALIDANTQLTDPDMLQIGDVLNIPTAPPDEVPNELPSEVTGSAGPTP